MYINMLKGKIHRATVCQAELDYVGSITIDSALLKAANISEYEMVQVVDINNGNRLQTYVIADKANSGTICVNGAAARLVQPGDKIIIMSYCMLSPEEARTHKPCVVFVDGNNAIKKVTHYERHGEIE